MSKATYYATTDTVTIPLACALAKHHDTAVNS